MDALGDLTGKPSRACGRERVELRDRRSRNLQVREPRDEQRDRLGIRPLVHAVERVRATRAQEGRDGLVGEDHQLLDQRVRLRLLLEPRIGDAAAAVEGERDLARVDLERAAREAAGAKRLRDLVVQVERGEDLRVRVAPLGLAVGEPGVRADHGPVELRLARRWNLDGDAQPVDVRP